MLDFPRFVQTFGLATAHPGEHHHAHEGWVQIHCPFCAGGMSGFHMGFNLERGNFNCWRCGGHSTFDVIGALLGTNDRLEIRRVYAENATSKPHQAPVRQQERSRPRRVPAPHGIGELSKQHRRFLRRRNFDPDELAEEWGLVGTTFASGVWNWRILTPIKNRKGFVVCWIGRSIKDGVKPKYRLTKKENCREDPATFLYGIEKVQNTVVIVEGPADVWRLGPGAVALVGIDWTIAQASILRRIERRFVMLDPDKNAQARAEKLAMYLGQFPGVTEIISGLESDPGDLGQARADGIMKELME